MTAIVGIAKDGKVWIGGDSAGVGGYQISTRHDPKVFVVGEFVIGSTGSYRMKQLLQYQLDVPTPYEVEDSFEFMVRRFIPAVKSCFRSGGWMTVDDGRDYGGLFLVGWRGELFRFEADFHVGRNVQQYDAVGCGDELALGSLHATAAVEGLTPEKRIEMALSAAEEFSAGVRGPFKIESVG